ncbi:hypothetical protein GCM10028798_19110 [Humibacter antri]
MKEPSSDIPNRDDSNRDIADGLRRRIVKERLVLAAVGVTAAAAVVGGLAAASVPASSPQTIAMRTVAAISPIVPAAGTSGSNAKGHLCGPVLLVVKRDYDRLPDALRKDVASARHQSSKAAEHTALANVLKKAQSGGYGTDIESVAKDKKTLAGFKAAWDRLPSSLRSDLKKAKAASGDTRTSDLKAVVSKAESGGYGDRVKAAVDKVKTRLDKCVARVQASGSTNKQTAPSTGTPAPSVPAPTPTSGA